MVKTRLYVAFLAIILFTIAWFWNGIAYAGCVVEGDAKNLQGPLKLRLSPDCSGAEREARALDAQKLLESIQNGRSIELEGVVIKGDLDLEKLPVSLNPPSVEGVTVEPGQDVRVVASPLSVVNSTVRGSVKHGSQRGMLMFFGSVSFAGTT
ncbi:hypothetical protein, partial [Petrachloros mirabilis]